MAVLRRPGIRRDLLIRALALAVAVFPLLGFAHHHDFRGAAHFAVGLDGRAGHGPAAGSCLACLAHHAPTTTPEAAPAAPVPPVPHSEPPCAGTAPLREVPRALDAARGPPARRIGTV